MALVRYLQSLPQITAVIGWKISRRLKLLLYQLFGRLAFESMLMRTEEVLNYKVEKGLIKYLMRLQKGFFTTQVVRITTKVKLA